jgi:murein DD-endopeptidase MepM/ murein hydrolase activator NlpD
MGKYIDVQHANGFMTRYTQLDDISVQEGQTVKQGEEIGQVGSTGLSTGPHLHFEIWKDGEHVNPADYIKF